MDVVQKVRDLSQLAFEERGNVNERLEAAVVALRLVEAYLLPKGKKKIEVAADILKKVMHPDFAEGVANHAEKFADGFDRVLGSAGRVLGSVKRVTDHLTQSDASDRARRGGKRKYSGR
jgi:hypothetical protein